MEDPKFQNCTEPVIQSFMGIPRMNMTNSNPCSLKDMAYNSESTIARFFEGESRECQGIPAFSDSKANNLELPYIRWNEIINAKWIETVVHLPNVNFCSRGTVKVNRILKLTPRQRRQGPN